MSDLIDRQEAIVTAVKAATDWHRLANPQYSIAYCIGEAMRALPTAQTEPKRGKWLPNNTGIRMYYVCSECKQATEIPKYVGGFLYNHCPNCGADMRGEENGCKDSGKG